MRAEMSGCFSGCCCSLLLLPYCRMPAVVCATCSALDLSNNKVKGRFGKSNAGWVTGLTNLCDDASESDDGSLLLFVRVEWVKIEEKRASQLSQLSQAKEETRMGGGGWGVGDGGVGEEGGGIRVGWCRRGFTWTAHITKDPTAYDVSVFFSSASSVCFRNGVGSAMTSIRSGSTSFSHIGHAAGRKRTTSSGLQNEGRRRTEIGIAGNKALHSHYITTHAA